MPEQQTPQTITPSDLQTAWRRNLVVAGCEVCQATFLLPTSARLPRCPNCFAQTLALLVEDEITLPTTRAPELQLPFSVATETLSTRLAEFVASVRFPPADLTIQNLKQRLQPLYLPRWLVDAHVNGYWQAETGFDYDVVSYQASYSEAARDWISREMTETRIRWEPRTGRVERDYHNVVAPALEENASLERRLGGFDPAEAGPYQPKLTPTAWMRLPNRPTADAWPDVVPQFRQAVAEDCRLAAAADHIRDFRWQVNFQQLNWTLLLLPVYLTHYLDDQAIPRPILIHGRSGKLDGQRRASWKKARRLALGIGVVAVVLFGLSMVVALTALFIDDDIWPLSVMGLLATVLVSAAMIIPLALAWEFNRSQERQEAE